MDSFSAQKGNGFFTKEEIEDLTIEDEDKSYSRKISFDCDYAEEIFLGEENRITCGIKNNRSIIIFSCRANKEVIGPDIVNMKIKEMTDYLNEHHVPFDSVYYQKPDYDVVIDDKAIRFENNWAQIKNALKGH